MKNQLWFMACLAFGVCFCSAAKCEVVSPSATRNELLQKFIPSDVFQRVPSISVRLSLDLRKAVDAQREWGIVNTYLESKTNGKYSCWIRSASNLNSVCKSGSLFSVIAGSGKSDDECVESMTSARDRVQYYLSGFGEDGYCPESIGYWGYGFGHCLYLAETLFSYTNETIYSLTGGGCPLTSIS